MAYLATLEGELEIMTDGQILDRLFDCNDVLGVMIYGSDSWNKLKSYAANLALKLLAAKRPTLGRELKKYYRSNRDVIDQAFGFNDKLGAELLGGEEWGHFVNNCKLAAPTLGYDWLNNLVVSPARNVVHTLLPKDLTSPKDWLKWLTGVQGIEAAFQTGKDITGYTEREEIKAKQEAAEREAEEYVKKMYEQQMAYEQQAAESEKQRQSDLEKAATEAEIEANKQMKIALNTDPNYLSAKTRNYVLFGTLGLAALYILTKAGK